MSERSLKFIAALIWYTGGCVLMLKGWRLLAEAEALQPGKPWTWLVAAVGVTIGVVKAKVLFVRSCRRNLARIDALKSPRIWQCFRPRFFLFLVVMIMAGAGLSRWAHDNYAFIIGVATLDISISTALFASSYIFWWRRPSRL